MTAFDVENFRPVIVRAFPHLASAALRPLTAGWESIAIEADGRMIFKFPRDKTGQEALRTEASLLTVIRPRITMPVPDMRLHEGPPLFSSHEKLPGDHLLADQYLRLSRESRHGLARMLGRFYAELHALGVEQMRLAGAGLPKPWQMPAAIRAKAMPRLPLELRERAEAALRAFEQLPTDPYGTTYGFFDGHGWNMAFDHARQRLNGIYDFADSGLGPLHQDFIYTSFISADLGERVIAAYEAETGRSLDRRRIAILTGVHRLSELAALADQPQHLSMTIGNVAAWADATRQLKLPG